MKIKASLFFTWKVCSHTVNLFLDDILCDEHINLNQPSVLSARVCQYYMDMNSKGKNFAISVYDGISFV